MLNGLVESSHRWANLHFSDAAKRKLELNSLHVKHLKTINGNKVDEMLIAKDKQQFIYNTNKENTLASRKQCLSALYIKTGLCPQSEPISIKVRNFPKLSVLFSSALINLLQKLASYFQANQCLVSCFIICFVFLDCQKGQCCK